jgi:hypothetical protein
MSEIDKMIRTFGALFWVGAAIAYLAIWWFLETIGFMAVFSYTVIQPFLPPDRDAHITVSLLGWLIFTAFLTGAAGSNKK